MISEITIRPMIAAEVKEISSIHIRSFKGFFLSFLGPRFLDQLYQSILESPGSIAWVAEGPDGILGFAAGSINTTGLYKNMIRKRLIQFAWASMGAFLQHPGIIFRLLRALRMPAEEPTIPDSGTLMSIAVIPEAQGNGIGKMLIKAFLIEARKLGAKCISLTTDRENNEATNQFYIKYGFSLVRYYATPEGRWINEYCISTNREDLKPSDA